MTLLFLPFNSYGHPAALANRIEKDMRGGLSEVAKVAAVSIAGRHAVIHIGPPPIYPRIYGMPCLMSEKMKLLLWLDVSTGMNPS